MVARSDMLFPSIDAERLKRKLSRRFDYDVRFDRGSRALYASDASNYRQVPLGVVTPRTVDDLISTVEICRDHGAPVLMRGGGTSQNGQCVNVAVVIDTSRHLNRVIEIDPGARIAIAEPGVVCDELNLAARAHGLVFGPDPATHSRCTLGGMIGNNSCGAHSVMAGKTVENVEALEILTYDGVRMRVGATSEREFQEIVRGGGRRAEIYSQLRLLRDRYADQIRSRFPKIKRRVSGYNLDQLLPEHGFNVARALVGSEGTCALTLRAHLKLISNPPCRVLLVLGFQNIYVAGDAAPDLLSFDPLAIEGLDDRIIDGLRQRGLRLDDIRQFPDGKAWVMVEFGGESAEAAIDQAQKTIAYFKRHRLAPSTWLISDAAQQARIWSIRETGASATTLALFPEAPDPAVGWEDAAVDPARLGDYLREFQALVDRYDYKTSLFGHFGDGCIHARITFDLRSRPGISKWKAFLHEAAELVVKFGGSLSGEHGDGQAKAEFLPVMFGEQLMSAFREFKQIWDPRQKLNPGKLIDAYRVDQNLRLGPDTTPVSPATHFSFSSPEGNGFARALERCVGMGKCRGRDSAIMCPSFRVTGEEQHSTRGRARLLQEMLRGEVIRDGWRSAEVKQALDLCFACKGCRSDCPTHTDMASYKAEFLAHYYEHHRRPRQAYGMGNIATWARFASKAPGAVNCLTQTPGLASLAKTMAGIAPQRNIPRFASSTFYEWFGSRRHVAGNGRRVLLWPDTFYNYFHPQVAIAAVEVMEAAGCSVVLPQSGLCCGRPLYDYGLLDKARIQLKQIMTALRRDIEAGTTIVGLEPACVTTFKDELLNFFPEDELAHKLSAQTILFGDFMVQSGWRPVPLGRKAIVHGHCHQKSVLGMDGDQQLLELLGVSYTVLNSGCCGMAGSFGFKPENYEISVRAGELGGLLPAVHAAAADTLIVTNGYSCREQIFQCTPRRALHTAEVARMALKP